MKNVIVKNITDKSVKSENSNIEFKLNSFRFGKVKELLGETSKHI